MDFFINTALAATEAAHDPGLLGLFGLNIKLFIAQLINFAVVCFIMWRWVYKPLTKRLAERSQTIEDSINTAEKIKQDKDSFGVWRKNEMEKTRQEAGNLIAEAKIEAEALKTRLLEKTKHEQDTIVQKSLEELQQAKEIMVVEAKSQIASIIVSATEKILKEKMSSAKDKHLIESAIKEIHI